MAVVASETFTSTSAPIQYAACAAFREDDEIDEYLVQSRRILRSLGRHLAATLGEAGASVEDPQGAFYLFPDFGPKREALKERGITTSAQLCEQLLADTGVALLPGRDFGRPAHELTARIAYVNFDGAEALEAAERVLGDEDLSESFLQAFCPGPLTAVERLCDWLSR
jgi:aspartate aminotransferase